MKKNVIDIQGIPFYSTTMNEFMKELKSRIINEQQTFIVTANPEIVEYALEDSDYRDMIQTADYIVPDGIGIIIASKILNKPLKERVTGFDMMQELFQLQLERPLRVYMLGAEPEIIKIAADKVRQNYPSVQLVGYHHGFIDLDDAELADQISSLGPDLVLLGTGFPRQEKWITQYRTKFKKGIFIGIGGSFDVLAGKLNRAPDIWIKLNLEWLYRLIKQPSRWRRMLVLPVFLLRIIKQKLMGSKRHS